MAKKDFIWATGRRKCASASVRICEGSGKITINNLPVEKYFKTEATVGYVLQPLNTVKLNGKIDIIANVKGGGPVGQAGAVRHGVARALTKQEESLRAPLKAAGLLTRDSRVKERKKPGQPGARKRFQFSKR